MDYHLTETLHREEKERLSNLCKQEYDELVAKWNNTYTLNEDEISAANISLMELKKIEKECPTKYNEKIEEYNKKINALEIKKQWIKIEGNLRLKAMVSLGNSLIEEFENFGKHNFNRENVTNDLKKSEKIYDDDFKNSTIYREVIASLIKPTKRQFDENYNDTRKRNKLDSRMAMIEGKCPVLKALFLSDQEYVVAAHFGSIIYNENFGAFSIASMQNVIVGIKIEKAEKNENKDLEKCQRDVKYKLKNIVLALNKVSTLNRNKKIKVSIINLDEKLLNFLDELQQGRTPSQFRDDQDIKTWGIKFLRCTRMEMDLMFSRKTSNYLSDIMDDCCLKNFEVAAKDYIYSTIFYDNE